ncbi:MAG: CheR family methyltransferase [Desulfotomaculales bacterium]
MLPDLIARKNPEARHLRVWCAGCATGEEAYTLAIILQEMTGGLEPPVGWEVHATDINTRSLEHARRGVYDARSVRCVPEPYLNRYFAVQGNRYRVNEFLRPGVRFYPLNLADGDAMRRMQNFDAIFCRNVLIYFDDNSRQEVALGFYDSLVEGGYIFLGHSESMSRITPVLKTEEIAAGFRLLQVS